MRALCQLCGEFYAEVSIEGVNGLPGHPEIAPLRYPLTGAMFGSADPFHSVPAPFDPSAEWQFAMCPFGRIHRPMVQDDLVLTHKGMVRLPKDGGPAFLDPTATGDVDRSSIGDRVIQVSDEEAERQVRENISPCESNKPEPVVTAEETTVARRDSGGGFPCPTCGKEFTEEKRLKMHVIGAHKRKKK